MCVYYEIKKLLSFLKPKIFPILQFSVVILPRELEQFSSNLNGILIKELLLLVCCMTSQQVFL